VLARAEPEWQAAYETEGEEDEGGQQEAVEDARFGRDLAELERDREPRRAPDRDAGDEELEITQKGTLISPNLPGRE
jgi:hypothetical protein